MNISKNKISDKRNKKIKILYYLKRDRWLYLMMIPVIAYYYVFKYIPMYGVVIAFKDFNMFKGITDSAWVGLKVFQKVFAEPLFWSSVKNTLVLNILTLLVNFPLTIILSLMINEVVSLKFKKLSQSLLYLPHFISWVVVAGMVTNLFSATGGTINNVLNSIGIPTIPFLSSDQWWIFTYVIANVWKEIGWGTIVYLAALTGLDETLYEAAYIDGASKMQRLWYITLPSIKPVIVMMLILSLSRMMTIGLDAPLLLGNQKVTAVSEVISTYVYKIGLTKAQYSMATAVGLFQSVINIILLLTADRFSKAMGEEGLL
ncbi:ABC transporter permease subunit [Anaerocolumna sedimenticola]|uniref:ABC transporter permease subunit n=1 Tax=Anaerocolumna sedimenticola TaxID=2696063 RepID=A0A6P1TMD3_9FIRM|nr:ABC transporter permease subunit [Anaerocolumna sedimenticola]QHQ62380.1 ABC transporter permease subunit [Anaerocolumna sedimenticola]